MCKGRMVMVLGWFDNEWGYSCRTADIVARVGKLA
jgi:glyceraldehyde 3-phosphate dehydrogenase